MISHSAFADCDFATMVKKLDDGTFNYSKECHQKNGENVRDLGIATKQVDLLNQAVQQKDIAIQKADERASRWMDTSFKLEDRVEKIDEMRKTNQWIYFGLGALTMIGAAYASKQLFHP